MKDMNSQKINTDYVYKIGTFDMCHGSLCADGCCDASKLKASSPSSPPAILEHRVKQQEQLQFFGKLN